MSAAGRGDIADETPARVDAWLAELGLEPVDRGERDGVDSWDLRLDGRRRRGLRLTLILDPPCALLAWVHFAPPMSNNLPQVSYRQFLRWNDELPFVKFALSADERPVLTSELAVERSTGTRWVSRSAACWRCAT